MAVETPVRRPRRSSISDRARRRSSLMGATGDGELTPSGVQIVHAGVRRSGRAITLQVLGVYRYVADPALRRELPVRAADALERDVFDLLLSDGQMKMKAILSPALNALVWQGLVGELDVVEIDDYELVNVTDDDDQLPAAASYHSQSSQPSRCVCVIHELVPRPNTMAAGASGSQSSAKNYSIPRTKILYSAGSSLLTSPTTHSSTAAPLDLQFIATAHIRDHGMMPLAGGRLYYLSLSSDDYPADWEPLQCEPLTPASQAIPWVEWDRRRRYCTDLFSAQDRVIHTIHEMNIMTSKRKRSATDELREAEEDTPPPPLVGIVHYKSRLLHLGDEHVSGPFPFMFHIVLADRTRKLEVAFFGSMAAKNFLTIQEGDLIQLVGYKIERSQPRRAKETSKKLFIYTHLSRGVVSHVPDKYWQMLEKTEVLPMRPRPQTTQSDGEAPSSHLTVWLKPVYITTQQTLGWEPTDENSIDYKYFDFVGVVTFVGRTHRCRDENGPVDTVSAVQSFRWIKVIDTSHSSEMVVRLFVSSQPTTFHAIQAGDVVMLSKLQWIYARGEDTSMAFATSSLYTTIRRNDDVEPFLLFPKCSRVFKLAKKLQTTGQVKTQYSALDSALAMTTESWLDGPGIEEAEPVHASLSMSDTIAEGLARIGKKSAIGSRGDAISHWIPQYHPHLSIAPSEYASAVGYCYPFSEVASVAESMDAMSHQYLRVHVALHDIRLVTRANSTALPEVELLVTDSDDHFAAPKAIRVRHSMLFRERKLSSPLDEMVTPEAEPLVRLLSSSAVASLNTVSLLRSTQLPQVSPLKRSPNGLDSPPREQEMTFDAVKAYILKHRQVDEEATAVGRATVGGMDIALHLYRMPHGEVDMWVDSISL